MLSKIPIVQLIDKFDSSNKDPEQVFSDELLKLSELVQQYNKTGSREVFESIISSLNALKRIIDVKL